MYSLNDLKRLEWERREPMKMESASTVFGVYWIYYRTERRRMVVEFPDGLTVNRTNMIRAKDCAFSDYKKRVAALFKLKRIKRKQT